MAILKQCSWSRCTKIVKEDIKYCDYHAKKHDLKEKERYKEYKRRKAHNEEYKRIKEESKNIIEYILTSCEKYIKNELIAPINAQVKPIFIDESFV